MKTRIYATRQIENITETDLLRDLLSLERANTSLSECLIITETIHEQSTTKTEEIIVSALMERVDSIQKAREEISQRIKEKIGLDKQHKFSWSLITRKIVCFEDSRLENLNSLTLYCTIDTNIETSEEDKWERYCIEIEDNQPNDQVQC